MVIIKNAAAAKDDHGMAMMTVMKTMVIPMIDIMVMIQRKSQSSQFYTT